MSSEEFAWGRGSLTGVSPVCWPGEGVSAMEVGVAVGEMEQGGSAGPAWVVAGMLGAAGEADALWMTEVCGAVVGDGEVPEGWSGRWMEGVCRGRDGALACGLCGAWGCWSMR